MNDRCEHGWEAKFGCAECVARVRAKYPDFPVMADRKAKPGPFSVPWAVADKAWAAYAQQYGTGQSVEQFVQRGGFYWGELDTFFPGWREATDEWARLRAQVAALTAERDALQKKWDGAETELNAIQRESNTAAAERDALRERVQALERACYRIRNAPPSDRMAAFSELDAALAEPGTAPARVVSSPTTGAEPLHCCGTTTDAHPGSCPTVQALAPLFPPASPEPSTAEAFAMVRAFIMVTIGRRPTPTEARAALALLERRMGAMGRLADEARTLRSWRENGLLTGPDVPALNECWQRLETALAALTDAPPVFTLEEVEALGLDLLVCTCDVQYGQSTTHHETCSGRAIRARLAALRK